MCVCVCVSVFFFFFFSILCVCMCVCTVYIQLCSHVIISLPETFLFLLSLSFPSIGPCNVNSPVQIHGDGDYPRFTCSATDVPSKNFTWKRQGQQEKTFITNDTKHTIISIRGSSQLTVKDVFDGNQGYYFCETDANINEPCSDTVFLQLKSKLSLILY